VADVHAIGYIEQTQLDDTMKAILTAQSGEGRPQDGARPCTPDKNSI
jgi:hypothetical protein